jgi:hypothetical protein
MQLALTEGIERFNLRSLQALGSTGSIRSLSYAALAEQSLPHCDLARSS